MKQSNNKILITCSKGVAPWLAAELESLGHPVEEEMSLGVFIRGSFEDCYRLNLQLRTGLRVLYLLKEFPANSPDSLYQGLFDLPWEEIVPSTGYLSVTSSVQQEQINNTQFANLKTKDAIVDRIASKKGRRPDSGPERDKTVVFLHWKENRAAIFLDTSGEPLSKRGYRKIPFQAPLQETLAAALIMATSWQPDRPFVNPMCGSGTLGIEAALMAQNRAPGLLRNNFGFMHTVPFNRRLYQEIRREVKALGTKPEGVQIICTDISPEAIGAARQNARTAGVEQLIDFQQCDFSETPLPADPGVVVLNPPYGERIGNVAELEELYKRIGDFFKNSCPGYSGYLLSGNLPLLKKVGLKSKKRHIFYTGKIETRFVEYELYSGTRRKM